MADRQTANPSVFMYSSIFEVGRGYHIHTVDSEHTGNSFVTWRVKQIYGEWILCESEGAIFNNQSRWINAGQIIWFRPV